MDFQKDKNNINHFKKFVSKYILNNKFKDPLAGINVNNSDGFRNSTEYNNLIRIVHFMYSQFYKKIST